MWDTSSGQLLPCPGCGAVMRPAARECPDCGLAFEVIRDAPSGVPSPIGFGAPAYGDVAGQQDIACPGCGLQLLASASECPDCGVILRPGGGRPGAPGGIILAGGELARYFPVEGLGRWAAALLDAAALSFVAYFCSKVLAISPASALRGVDWVLVALGVELLVFALPVLASPIVFLVWFYYSYRNLAALDRLTPRYRSLWQVCGFLVPLLLYRPWGMMCEMWRGSGPIHDPDPDPSPVHIWWLAWLGSWVVGPAGYVLSSAAGYRSAWSDAAANGLAAAAAALASFLVRRVTEMQANRWREVLETRRTADPLPRALSARSAP